MNRTIGKRASPGHIAGAHRAQASVDPHLGISGMQVILHAPIKDGLLVLLLYFKRRVAPQQSAFRAVGGVSFGLISDVAVRIPGVKGRIVLLECRLDVLYVISHTYGRQTNTCHKECSCAHPYFHHFHRVLPGYGVGIASMFIVEGVNDDSKLMDRLDVVPPWRLPSVPSRRNITAIINTL